MQVGIAMLPDDEMLASMVDLQKQVIPSVPLRPILGIEVNIPHITLLQGRFREDVDWVGLFSALRDRCIAQKYSLELELTRLEYIPAGWYFLTIKHNVLLFAAHQFVFERLKDSMFLTAEDRQNDTSAYTPLERNNYLTYGYRFIGDAYHPHITLGRSPDRPSTGNEAGPLACVTEQINLVESLLSKRKGTIRKITLYEMGENGSHAATLHELEI